MPDYVILDIEVFNKEKLQEYKNVAPEIIKTFGGKIIVRGGESRVVEGNWNPKRVVIIEFPDYKTANDWWISDAYKNATELRKKGGYTNVIIIEGI